MQKRLRNRTLDLSPRVAIVGVINATPDSYFKGSRIESPEEGIQRVKNIIADGADIVEIGGESTGPGSKDVSPEEECKRVLPVVVAIRRAFPDIWIAVDTHTATVASQALIAGADMINDVTAGRSDPEMFSVIARSGCPYVMMYAKDPVPRTTVKPVQYDDVIKTIRLFLTERKARAMAAGIKESQIIIDPGLGHFLSSDPKYSFEVINRLKELCDLGPVFLSPSRKSFLAGDKNDPPDERLPATLAVTAVAVLNGARLIRTHDVRATRQVVMSVLAMDRRCRIS